MVPTVDSRNARQAIGPDTETGYYQTHPHEMVTLLDATSGIWSRKTRLAKEAWRDACEIKGANVKLTPPVVKILLRRTSHVRGELKIKMRSLTSSFFGFQPSLSRDVIGQNQDLAESLKNGSAFAFKDWTLTGLYKYELLQDGSITGFGVEALTLLSAASRIGDKAFDDAIHEYQLEEEEGAEANRS
ncbi:uncharacterized protein F5147DRAFT_657890 [Suillus discolor]|uniref:DUF6532 domain-containing protein n=1 Tax=Suillus discolor TaxID=1912936 RepID=A0A9P7JKZ1_9AGAM|nr:uncharacterized protein F5147DRAFT_661183 [Suillus discolor]XP_041286626.1 uncharacterized protein F5147DRAFT_657890 [Suillus discolor]KAG2080594.1 hypothetical protein F5147DRAFT_661183 [Suillus discolor]KAG2091666.1 hypothetical protein F5147DRAFT_657890 [Suillus discolor]